MECAVFTEHELTPVATSERFDVDLPWRIHPRVDIRPERFGALIYHFGTRRLTFVKSATMLTILQALAVSPTARDAIGRAGVPDNQIANYEHALCELAASGVICGRS